MTAAALAFLAALAAPIQASLDAPFQDLPAPRFQAAQEKDATGLDALLERLDDDSIVVRHKAVSETTDFLAARGTDKALRERAYQRLRETGNPELYALLGKALDAFFRRMDKKDLRADRAAEAHAALKARMAAALRERTPPRFALRVEVEGETVVGKTLKVKFFVKNATDEDQVVYLRATQYTQFIFLRFGWEPVGERLPLKIPETGALPEDKSLPTDVARVLKPDEEIELGETGEPIQGTGYGRWRFWKPDMEGEAQATLEIYTPNQILRSEKGRFVDRQGRESPFPRIESIDLPSFTVAPAPKE